MSQSSESVPSGLTVDGIAIPQTVEAEGAEAVESYVAAQRAVADVIAPVSPANPPTFAEGAEA